MLTGEKKQTVGGGSMATNPRYSNGNLRRKYRAKYRAMELPCHLCGRPIHYDEPSDPQHPLSFVIDEIIPVSKWKQFGYSSPRAVAEDPTNIAPAHYRCNQIKGNKLMGSGRLKPIEIKGFESDGEW